MQIHELNDYIGSLGAGDYLAIDNGTDTGKISAKEFVDSAASAVIPPLWYGTSSTASGTSIKVVDCTGFQLATGAVIAVKFSNAQTYTGSVYLNVNGTGAKQVYGIPRSTTSNTRLDGAWESSEVKLFAYDGTYWRMIDQNIITSSQLSTLESTLGLSGTTSLRLFEILKKLASDAFVETGTSNGWTYKKYADGTMRAERTITSGTTWSQVGSSGVYCQQISMDLPSGMTFFAGYASLTIKSTYVVGAQVQKNESSDGLMLSIHRLSSSAVSVTYKVVIEGTYS